MDIISDDIRKANKIHKCDYCGLEIVKGEIYRNATIINDEIYTWKSHLICEEICRKLELYDYADGVDMSYFKDSICDYLNDNNVKYSGWADAYAKVKLRLFADKQEVSQC